MRNAGLGEAQAQAQAESEQAPGVGDGQGGLACCNPWGRREADMTERLSWTEPNQWPNKQLEINNED